MYTVLVFVSIGILLAVTAARNDLIAKLLAALLSGLISLLVGTLVAAMIAAFVPTVDVEASQKLVAMRSSDSVSGTFIRGTGTINGTSYDFMLKLDDGSMALGSVPANSVVRIIEDGSLNGNGYLITTIRKSDSNSMLYGWALFSDVKNIVVRQEFRVPVGTVVQNFKVE